MDQQVAVSAAMPGSTHRSPHQAAGAKQRRPSMRKKAACGEIYTIDKNGARVELFVDPTSGNIVGQL
jgi:hypothetical protein